MTDPARIGLDPTILAGKPVIRGTRLSVDFVFGLMADGWNEKSGHCQQGNQRILEIMEPKNIC